MPEALWGWPPPVFDPAGPYASSVTVLAWALLAMGLIVTSIIGFALYVAIKGPTRWRRTLGGERAVWIGGVAFPTVVLTALLVWGLTLTAALDRPVTGEEMRVRVTGEMWWFRVDYLGKDGEVVIRDANELHLPVGQPVVLELRSADVIHSLWIPHLSGKKDMVPGRTNLLRVQADEAGRYGGVCAEYCGGPHALMGFVAVAHEADEWRRWRDARLGGTAAPGPPPPAIDAIDAEDEPVPVRRSRSGVKGDDAAAGHDLFMTSGCAACHRIGGTRANGLAGPDLTHVGSRMTLGAGILPNNRGTLIGWIGDSQSIKPGNRMPSYDMLSAAELSAIASFLEAQE